MASNKQIIWDFLFKQGLTTPAVFGLMGNLKAESALIPTNLQDSYERKLGYTDKTYTEAVDKGTYINFATDEAGYGLAQWTSPGRKEGLLQYAKKTGKSIGDIIMQLEYLMYELRGSYRSVFNDIQAATTIRQASDIVLTRFERPRDQGTHVKAARAASGEALFLEYKQSGGTQGISNPYAVPTSNVQMARNEVRWIQYQLNAKGYSLSVDGIWGNRTEEAVRAFQADNGLAVDGIVGPATRAKLSA